jgi:hypothetical protein
VWPDVTHGLEVDRGHVLDSAQRQLAIHALRLESVEGLLVSQPTREITQVEYVTPGAVHTEERRFRPLHLNRYERPAHRARTTSYVLGHWPRVFWLVCPVPTLRIIARFLLTDFA